MRTFPRRHARHCPLLGTARLGKAASVTRVLAAVVRGAKANGLGRQAASLAFFALFAMPGVLLVVAWATSSAGGEGARGGVVENVRSWAGPEAAGVVHDVLASAEPSRAFALGPWLAAAVLLIGASGFFLQLQDALNAMWSARQEGVPRRRGVAVFVLRRLLSFGLVLALAVLLLASLAASTVLSAFGDHLASRLGIGGGAVVAILASEAVSCALVAALLAGIYRYMPDARIEWREVRIGALVTAVLFVAAKYGMGVYLARSTPGSVFGAAGPLAVVLLWAYASTLLVLLGAELTHVLARRRSAVAGTHVPRAAGRRAPAASRGAS